MLRQIFGSVPEGQQIVALAVRPGLESRWELSPGGATESSVAPPRRDFPNSPNPGLTAGAKFCCPSGADARSISALTCRPSRRAGHGNFQGFGERFTNALERLGEV